MGHVIGHVTSHGSHDLSCDWSCDSPHEFKVDAEMVSEVEIIDHVNDVVLVVVVLQSQWG